MTQCEYNIWQNVKNLISLSHSDSFFGPVGRSLRMMLFSNIPLFLLHQIVWHYLKKSGHWHLWVTFNPFNSTDRIAEIKVSFI